MGISSIGATAIPTLPTSPDPQATAYAGLQNAQNRVDQGARQVASGNLDPAVVVDIKSAETDFAANVKVMRADQENSKRLLDMLA